MHNNFSDFEISNLARVLGSEFNVRRNKAGNISVEYLPEFSKCGKWDKKYWTLYFTSDGTYLWRRWTSTSYCFPLHGVNRKRIGDIHHENYNGHKYTWYYREWDIKNCEFDTYEDAISYFVYYLRKYRNIDLKTTPINPTVIAEEYAKEKFTQEYVDGCTDSDHFDWLDWFDNKYPYRTKNERTKFALVIEDLYNAKVHEFHGKEIDYSSLREAERLFGEAHKLLLTVYHNNNLPYYENEVKDCLPYANIGRDMVKKIADEIYRKYFK
jgi:hypothetical protein